MKASTFSKVEKSAHKYTKQINITNIRGLRVFAGMVNSEKANAHEGGSD
jgi:hypothetical protein